MLAEGSDSLVEAESAILESLSRYSICLHASNSFVIGKDKANIGSIIAAVMFELLFQL